MILNTHYPYFNRYFTIESKYSGLTDLVSGTSGSWDGVLEYSTDLVTWNRMTPHQGIQFRRKVYLRGTGNTKITGVSDVNAHWTISNHEAEVWIYGDIDALLDYQTYALSPGPTYTPPTMANFAFAYMFGNWTTLINTPRIRRTNVSKGCFNGMFSGCSNLRYAPVLTATVMKESCYEAMFINCSHLTKPAVCAAISYEKACFKEMYKNCTSLIEAPGLRSTAVYPYSCMQMFYGCSALTTVPQFTITVSNDSQYSFYEMFYGCSSIYVSTDTWQTQSYPNFFFKIDIGNYASTLQDMLAHTGGPFDGTPKMGKTYYTSNPVV